MPRRYLATQLPRLPASMLRLSSMATGETKILRGMSGMPRSKLCGEERCFPCGYGDGLLPGETRCHEPGKQLEHLRKVTQLAKLLALSPARRHPYWMEHFSPEARQRLYTRAFGATVMGSDPEGLFAEAFGQSDTEEWVDTMLDADINLYLPENILVKIDRATMARSLEARSPFLDHVLMEYVASLPSRLKFAGGQQDVF